jgi:hypothetical protein
VAVQGADKKDRDRGPGSRIFVLICRSNRDSLILHAPINVGAIAMFQFLRKPSSRTQFRARSAGRDAETDQARASSILRTIDEALEAAKIEKGGLSVRIDDVLGRAAVTFGNASDEYLTREPQDSRHQDLMGHEIANGQRRLTELDATIAHFEFLRTAVLSRFPNLGAASAVPVQNATE